jgi:hypothetical protein
MGPRPTDLGAAIQRRLEALDGLIGDRAASSGALDIAEAAGVDLARVSGPLAERAVQLWGIRRMARAASKVAHGKHGGPVQDLMERAAANGIGRLAAPVGKAALGAFGGGAAYSLTAGAVRMGMRFAGQMGEAAARTRDTVARAVDRALDGGKRVRPLSRAATAVRTSYDPEVTDEAGTRDFRTKAAQLRRLAGSEDALRAHVRSQIGDLAKMDPAMAQAVEDVAVKRVTQLTARLPAYMAHGHPLVDPEKSPLNVRAVRTWELYEAVTANPALAWQFVETGNVPSVVGEALREQHPEQFNEMVKQVLSDPARLKRADTVTLKGLSELIGIPLIPQADPAFRARQIARAAMSRAAQQDIQSRQQGAAALRGGLHGRPVPTPGQAASAGPIGNR